MRELLTKDNFILYGILFILLVSIGVFNLDTITGKEGVDVNTALLGAVAMNNDAACNNIKRIYSNPEFRPNTLQTQNICGLGITVQQNFGEEESFLQNEPSLALTQINNEQTQIDNSLREIQISSDNLRNEQETGENKQKEIDFNNELISNLEKRKENLDILKDNILGKTSNDIYVKYYLDEKRVDGPLKFEDGKLKEAKGITLDFDKLKENIRKLVLNLDLGKLNLENIKIDLPKELTLSRRNYLFTISGGDYKDVEKIEFYLKPKKGKEIKLTTSAGVSQFKEFGFTNVFWDVINDISKNKELRKDSRNNELILRGDGKEISKIPLDLKYILSEEEIEKLRREKEGKNDEDATTVERPPKEEIPPAPEEDDAPKVDDPEENVPEPCEITKLEFRAINGDQADPNLGYLNELYGVETPGGTGTSRKLGRSQGEYLSPGGPLTKAARNYEIHAELKGNPSTCDPNLYIQATEIRWYGEKIYQKNPNGVPSTVRRASAIFGICDLGEDGEAGYEGDKWCQDILFNGLPLYQEWKDKKYEEKERRKQEGDNKLQEYRVKDGDQTTVIYHFLDPINTEVFSSEEVEDFVMDNERTKSEIVTKIRRDTRFHFILKDSDGNEEYNCLYDHLAILDRDQVTKKWKVSENSIKLLNGPYYCKESS